jgi:cellulose synthase/poly-beta-1,6-N-acetylglucosamine synthase-like glycosyltransferase
MIKKPFRRRKLSVKALGLRLKALDLGLYSVFLRSFLTVVLMYKLPAYLSWSEIWFILFCLICFVQIFYYGWFFQRLAFFRKPSKDKSQQHPVSVIICARDEAANLAENLPGALSQTYPSTHEVIVVNHNSQDDTRYLLEEFKKTFKGLHIVNLEYEAKGIPGKKYPLSMGIREAKHEVLVLTDSDCIPASEFWVEKMQDGYQDGTQIVLGYSPYRRKPGMLNKIIRFETFHSALQYLSYALAGQPYMGVGRNLSYKKELFLKNKGFSSINHVPGGDDDLFINKVATSANTRIVIDPESFTISEPKRTFGEWVRQKTRHYTTGKYYKTRHKFLLMLYSVSHILFYPAFVMSLLYPPVIGRDWVLAVFLLRLLVQGIVYFRCMKKLGESDLFLIWWLLDILMIGYYFIFAPSLWKKPRAEWR